MKNRKIPLFIGLLEDVIKYIDADKSSIVSNGWNTSQLEEVILPEMKELLLHAEKGEVFFKYGKKQRLLSSTYLITDSLESLGSTVLGKKISEIQEMYYNL